MSDTRELANIQQRLVGAWLAGWRLAFLGAAAFVVLHAVEVLRWRAWFDPAGQNPPWFLNNGTAVAFVAAIFLLIGVIVGLRSTGSSFAGAVVDTIIISAGAAVAMLAVLLWIGPGTIFPIVIVVGFVIVAVSSTVGATIGWGGGHVLTPSP